MCLFDRQWAITLSPWAKTLGQTVQSMGLKPTVKIRIHLQQRKHIILLPPPGDYILGQSVCIHPNSKSNE